MNAPTGRERRVVAIVQARLGSVRLPGKVLQPVLGQPLIGHLVERLGRAKNVHQVVLAIPVSSVNDSLEDFARGQGIAVSRGSELDVLDRYAGAAEEFPADAYLRITADCPLVDPRVIDRVIDVFYAEQLDYASTGQSFPDGLDVEVFRASVLRDAAENARDNYDREHVTPYIQRSCKESSSALEFSSDLSRLRLTVDEPEDLAVLEAIFAHFGHNRFTIENIEELAREKPLMFVANQHLVRNAGATMGTGQKLWSRARRVIPGGNMLLSKRAEMFLPEGWPAYYSRTQGCAVWDLDDQKFFDVGFMGIGTNILGYSHPEVDNAVIAAVSAGNLSTLNSPEEVFLAEKLCELHPWAEMARFTRSGGEACAVAVRIARAAAGKDAVAFCGYHGWHDWYLSANIGVGSALDRHLLAGLEPAGVPGALGGSARPFEYNNLGQLEAIMTTGDVGVIFMEVERTFPPQPGFLEGVRELADKHGAVLVFDECTSGFRQLLGGLHGVYGVEPDIAVLGKTLGNGYAINAVIGQKAIMQAAQSTFISSTFWTERIGPTAALAALHAMETEDAPARVHSLGLDMRSSWTQLAEATNLDIAIAGIPALSTYSLIGFDPLQVKTFITQQMLAQGFLATTAYYASIAHTPEILRAYVDCLFDVFEEISALGPEGLQSALPHGSAHGGFTRLN
jgi:glutamate-1-semialdehyde 2,1-aminomutase